MLPQSLFSTADESKFRGLKPNVLWQMDVFHIPKFGCLSYVHVTIDTYFHTIMATAQTGEAIKDVIQHLVACFFNIWHA